MRASVVWLVHGTVVLRTLSELVRPEYPAERSDWESTELGKPTTTTTADELLTRLRATRSAVHFEDLTGEPWPGQTEEYEEPVFDEEGTRQESEAHETSRPTTPEITRNKPRSKPTPIMDDSTTTTTTPPTADKDQGVGEATDDTADGGNGGPPKSDRHEDGRPMTTGEERSVTPPRWF